VERTDEKLV